MSSRMTMILAALFLFGALLAGYWGFVLSRPAEQPVPAATPAEQPIATAPAPPPQPPEPLRSPIVVLRKALPANTPVSADDVLLERLQVVPDGAFQAIDQVIGRTSARPLAAGSWLDESSFENGGPLARMIRSHERAVAIGVDEVIGAAGQMAPGDYVDVLLYLREDTSNPQSSAQVVLPALRVLSIGEQMGVANDGHPAQSAEALKARREQGNPVMASGTRTVVLAVPEAFASRLMLAAQVGTLRLAVRSADEQRLANYWAEHDNQPQVETLNRELYRFSQLSQAPLSKPAAVTAVAGMQVIRGAQAAGEKNTP